MEEKKTAMEQIKHPFSERVLRDMSDAVLVLDSKGGIVYVNRPASRMLEVNEGFREENVRFPLLSESAYNDSFNEAILDALYDKEKTTVKKVPYMAPSGKKYIVLLSSSYLQEPDSKDVQLVITINDMTVAEEMTRKYHDSSNTFSTFLCGFGVWILICALWEFLGRPISADYLTHGVEILGLLMLVFILRLTSLTWRDLGVTTHEPAKTLRTALIVAACSFGLLCAIKAVARMIDPMSFEPNAPFLDLRRFGLRQVLYIFTAGIQEFLARSVMQGNLKRILAVKHAGAMSIVLSSLIFAALHIHLGFLFMVGAAILAGLEGILYEKQQNIFGVWLVHWVFGVSGTLLYLIDH